MALVTSITSVREDSVSGETVSGESIAWNSPEPKLWVGNRSGEYAGMVEYTAGHFVATGPFGERFGSYSDVAQAMAAVDDRASGLRMRDGLLSNVALVSAVVAISVAGMSLTMIAA
jgi:hypothetical protein